MARKKNKVAKRPRKEIEEEAEKARNHEQEEVLEDEDDEPDVTLHEQLTRVYKRQKRIIHMIEDLGGVVRNSTPVKEDRLSEIRSTVWTGLMRDKLKYWRSQAFTDEKQLVDFFTGSRTGARNRLMAEFKATYTNGETFQTHGKKRENVSSYTLSTIHNYASRLGKDILWYLVRCSEIRRKTLDGSMGLKGQTVKESVRSCYIQLHIVCSCCCKFTLCVHAVLN